MTARKERLTVTVDADLLAAANAAVRGGAADSLSAWVNRALADRIDRERRFAALEAAIAAYEAEFGVMTAEELAAQARADRHNSTVVQPRGPGPRRKTPQRRSRAA